LGDPRRARGKRNEKRLLSPGAIVELNTKRVFKQIRRLDFDRFYAEHVGDVPDQDEAIIYLFLMANARLSGDGVLAEFHCRTLADCCQQATSKARAKPVPRKQKK
jgi:hypothetical protein